MQLSQEGFYIVVNYYSEEQQETVVEHLTSLEFTVVTAGTLFQGFCEPF